MNKVKLSIPMYVFLMGFVTLLILSITAKGESQWISGTNNKEELVRDQPIEINFDNPKYVSKMYIEAGCEKEIAIYGNIQFYAGFGDNQIIVLTLPFSKVLCGDTINVVPDIKTTKIKLLMTQALPPPYGGMSQPEYKVSLTTWKVYAGDTPITTQLSVPNFSKKQASIDIFSKNMLIFMHFQSYFIGRNMLNDCDLTYINFSLFCLCRYTK